MKMYRRCFKRFFDFFIALLGLLVAAPFLLTAMVVLYFANQGAGVFFFQRRPGKGGKIFRVIKFKTMTDERDAAGNLLPDADRLTKTGRFFRSASVDELPQLINVLKGDMSLIGPRPLAVQYLPYYNETEKRRHEVRPGITGLAQVNGRNAISWEERFSYDVAYVDRLSFGLDVQILMKTVSKVIKRADIGMRGVDLIDFDKYRQQQLNNRNNEHQG